MFSVCFWGISWLRSAFIFFRSRHPLEHVLAHISRAHPLETELPSANCGQVFWRYWPGVAPGYITLLSWAFLFKCYNFCWNLYWNREVLLCTTISIDSELLQIVHSQTSFTLCYGVGVGDGLGNFGKAVVGVEHFTCDSAILW